MALPSSGTISISNLNTEFGRSASAANSSLSLFYRGGGIVPNTTANSSVPTSGTISLSNFYGARNTPTSIDLLVVAGGGGGSHSNDSRLPGGAGGAGGYISQTSFSINTGTYTVTVGSGGASGLNTAAARGGNSVFSGPSITTQTAYGGGCGGTNSTSPALAAQNGGSGGGGGGNVTTFNGGRGVYPGSTYISAARQGYDGAGGGGFFGHGGGGGGAAAAGSVGTGGAGIANSISGSSVTYATGGTYPNTSTGTANTGNGGNTDGEFVSRAGNSGVVILRYPSTFPAATSTTGSPSVTVSGGYRIYRWTGSGSITF